jgi:hypothetical protein
MVQNTRSTVAGNRDSVMELNGSEENDSTCI